MARRGPIGGAFGKSIRKKHDTGTHNLEGEPQVRQFLEQKSAELEEMRKTLGPLANELVRHGLTPKEAELAMPYIRNQLGRDERQYLEKNPEMFAKLAKSAAEVESVGRSYKAASDAKKIAEAEGMFKKYIPVINKLNEIKSELSGKIKEAERGERKNAKEEQRSRRKNAPDPRNPLDMLFNQGLGIRLRATGYDAYREVIAAIREEYPAVLKLTNPDKIREVVGLISAKVVDERNMHGGRFPDPWYQDAFANRIEETHKEILKKLEMPA